MEGTTQGKHGMCKDQWTEQCVMHTEGGSHGERWHWKCALGFKD